MNSTKTQRKNNHFNLSRDNKSRLFADPLLVLKTFQMQTLKTQACSRIPPLSQKREGQTPKWLGR
jgi:hypothetical protein